MKGCTTRRLVDRDPRPDTRRLACRHGRGRLAQAWDAGQSRIGETRPARLEPCPAAGREFHGP